MTIAALRDEPFVLFPRAVGPEFYDRILSLCGTAGYQPKVSQEAVEWQTVVSLVGESLGVSVAPACMERLRWPNVVFKTLSPAGQRTQVSLCHLRANVSPLLMSFKALVRDCVSGQKTR